MKPQNREIIKAGIKWDALILIGFMMVLTGYSMNSIAIDSNHGMMPFYSSLNLLSSDNLHFRYTSFDQVNYPLLTDIFPLKFKDLYIHFSIGDVFSIFGAIWGAVSLIVGGFMFFTNVKKIKRFYNYGF